MKIHFIAIGGSAMHNLAIALKRKGYEVSGSDDEIFEPSKGRLQREGLLPESMGWNPERIHKGIHAVVLGMHARSDNPEMIKARDLGIPIYSYPEYIYQQTQQKKRVVIGGSHGKTTVTSMILHVLQKLDVKFDYLVGAQLEGYDCMVGLSESAQIAIIEGDEYLSSALDRRPKFHLYKPHIAVITGIAWDHINVFPTFENYCAQFQTFVDLIEPQGSLIYFEGDHNLNLIAESSRKDVRRIPYQTHEHLIENGVTYAIHQGKKVPLAIFGAHNLQNLNAAVQVLLELGLDQDAIYQAISSFKGAAKRLELVSEKGSFKFFKDFAHAPSKLKATIEALRVQFPERDLVACMELHTFSSLNKLFLPLYSGSMAVASEALVYFSPEVVAHKRLEALSVEEVERAFGTPNIRVFTDSGEMQAHLESLDWTKANLLMMSSGNFDGIDFARLAEMLIASLPQTV